MLHVLCCRNHIIHHLLDAGLFLTCDADELLDYSLIVLTYLLVFFLQLPVNLAEILHLCVFLLQCLAQALKLLVRLGAGLLLEGVYNAATSHTKAKGVKGFLEVAALGADTHDEERVGIATEAVLD